MVDVHVRFQHLVRGALVADVVELAGFALVAAGSAAAVWGASMIAPGLGVLAAGVVAVLLGVLAVVAANRRSRDVSR